MAWETLDVDSCLLTGAIVATLVNYEVKLNTAIAASNAINQVAILSFFVIPGILPDLAITDVILGTRNAMPFYLPVLDISWPIVSFLNFTVILSIFMTIADRIVTACVATNTSFP